jgi:hypothetical protein
MMGYGEDTPETERWQVQLTYGMLLVIAVMFGGCIWLVHFAMGLIG